MDRRVTFIVRLTVTESGRATGIVELVSTGRKEPLRQITALAEVIAGMLDTPAGDRGPPGSAPEPPQQPAFRPPPERRPP
jgi:hypothetical protein